MGASNLQSLGSDTTGHRLPTRHAWPPYRAAQGSSSHCGDNWFYPAAHIKRRCVTGRAGETRREKRDGAVTTAASSLHSGQCLSIFSNIPPANDCSWFLCIVRFRGRVTKLTFPLHGQTDYWKPIWKKYYLLLRTHMDEIIKHTSIGEVGATPKLLSLDIKRWVNRLLA